MNTQNNVLKTIANIMINTFSCGIYSADGFKVHLFYGDIKGYEGDFKLVQRYDQSRFEIEFSREGKETLIKSVLIKEKGEDASKIIFDAPILIKCSSQDTINQIADRVISNVIMFMKEKTEEKLIMA